MIAALVSAFRDGSDDPSRALERALVAAERAKRDKAVLTFVADAHAEAEAAGERYRRGVARGALDGVPIAVKDCIDVAGLPTTNGTKFLLQPVTADAIVVARLRAAGAVLFAKTNMHEFGIQPTGINPHYGTPVNPWDGRRIPGGSSSGSSVAVASGIAAAAVGTDAGGSIRIPAAINGVVGLKPTFGVIPLEGVRGLTLDLDHVGPIARSVDDAALLFETMAGRGAGAPPRTIKAGVLADLFDGAEDIVIATVRDAVRNVFGLLEDVPTPSCAWASAVEFVIVATDAQQTCAHHLRDRAKDIAPDTRVILRLGSGLSRDDRRRADRMRAAMRQELDTLLREYDVLISPATGSLPPMIHEAARKSGELDTAKMARLAAQAFVTNLTGHPSVVVPCVRDGLPIAMQIIGRHDDEGTILAAARAVEDHFPFRRPPAWYADGTAD